jgi:hypothetical protein
MVNPKNAMIEEKGVLLSPSLDTMHRCLQGMKALEK